MALIKIGLIYSYYFEAPPIPVYCIPRVIRNNKELIFKRSGTSKYVVGVKLEIWSGNPGRIGKSISAKIRIYINASRFQSGPFKRLYIRFSFCATRIGFSGTVTYTYFGFSATHFL